MYVDELMTLLGPIYIGTISSVSMRSSTLLMKEVLVLSSQRDLVRRFQVMKHLFMKVQGN
jgi:hypothetical protein